MVFWNRQRKLEDMLDQYQDELDAMVKEFSRVFDEYLEHGRTEYFEKGVQAVHKCESQADDLRREIEMTLYGKQLLPESRGDLLGVLEAVDRIPNVLETLLFILCDEFVEIPDFLKPGLRDLVAVNIETYNLVRKAFDTMLHNPAETLWVCKEIDTKESESDHQERALIRQVYQADMELARKAQLKEIVLTIGKVSDRGENFADRLAIIAIKRNI